LVEVAIAVTVTPGITAPLGSVITPEMEPVMSAREIEAERMTVTPRTQRRKILMFDFITAPKILPTEGYREALAFDVARAAVHEGRHELRRDRAPIVGT
jgi:hypothetical protein